MSQVPTILSDRHARKVIPGLLLGLAMLAVVSIRVGLYPKDGYWAAIRDPETWDGEEIVITLFAVSEINDYQHFAIRRGTRVARMEGDTTGLTVGETVSVIGRFRATDSTLRVDQVEPHPLFAGKRRLGQTAVAVLLIGLPFWFTIRGRRVAERA